MTVIDFIDISDHDIIDLSSDDETVQEDQIATQYRTALLDSQTMLVVAGEGSQDVQAAFVAASEGCQDVQAEFAAASEVRQEAAECGHALEGSTSFLVTEKAPLVAASEGSKDVQVVFVAVREGSEDVQNAFVAAGEGSQDVKAVLVAATEGRQEAADSGNALEATASSLVTEKAPLDMAESHNCPRSPTSAPLPSPTSTVLKAPTSEGGDAKLIRGKVKHPRKNYHTRTPRTSPRFELKPECRNGPLEELPAEALTSEGGDAELVREKMQHPGKDCHTGTPGTSPRFEPKRECHNGPVKELPAVALTSEGANTKLLSGKVKHPRMNYHTSTPRISPRFVPKLECHNRLVEELPAEALTSEGGNEELVRGELKRPRKNYHAGTPRTSPRFEQKLDCHNGSVEELPAEALISEGGDAELVRGKLKRPTKNYHTGTPRTSPRFEPKHEYHNVPVEELPAEALTSEGGDAELVRGKVKRPTKNYHTGTPRTSPRFELKHEYHNGPVEELPAEALASEGGDAELVRGKLKHPRKNYPAGTPRTSPRFEPKRECHNGSVEELPAEVLISEGGDAELVRGEVKHHTGTPRTSPRFQLKRECRNGFVEELPAEALTFDGAEAELLRGKMKHARKDYQNDTPRTSPRFEQKLDCRNRPVEELPAEALTIQGVDAVLVRGKVKHARKVYHTDAPRTSPRFQLKRERRKGPIEELAADHKRFRTLEELIASPDSAESAKTPSTDSLN